MVGFTLLSRSYYYLRRRSPGRPPVPPPDHRQAGERGAIKYSITFTGGHEGRKIPLATHNTNESDRGSYTCIRPPKITHNTNESDRGSYTCIRPPKISRVRQRATPLVHKARAALSCLFVRRVAIVWPEHHLEDREVRRPRAERAASHATWPL